ncbi:DUF6415 family natural product biosynthesis protein [Streptomyces sp. NPDC058642]|uniref:DUF6415 family natural product biosynthesis protein n=1 Tax=Streptomyces sp. NPDC058642 TaxID=3346572 RepID=UPI0036470C93
MRNTTIPLDIEPMRAEARRVLDVDAPEMEYDTAALEQLAVTFREQIRGLIPEVGAKAQQLPRTSADRACAMACVGEAEMRLRIGPGDSDLLRGTVAQKLARSVVALCGHYARMSAR